MKSTRVENRLNIEAIGSPVTESTTVNINLVHAIITDNLFVTYDQIEEETDILKNILK